MRYWLYAIGISLSLYFLIHPQSSSASAPHLDMIEKVNRLVQEYNYQDIPHDRLKTIWTVANIVHDMPKTNKVEIFKYKHIEGSFFKIPDNDAILYCPSLTDKYVLGRGAHKKVFRALYFTPQTAEVVAACRGDDTILHEAKILKLVALKSSVTPFRCFFALSNDKYMLVLRYYNMGGLGSLRKKGFRFNHEQKMYIARDLILALMDMHKKGVVHRDLHDGNVLLHRSREGYVHAGLIDFGRASPLYTKSKGRPQGARSRTPPEVLIKSFSSIDQKSSDIYALGCCFYILFFEEDFSPGSLYDVHSLNHMTQQDKQATYEKVLLDYACVYEKQLALWDAKQLHGESSLEERNFYQIIFAMVHPDPSMRPDSSEIAASINKVIQSFSINAGCTSL